MKPELSFSGPERRSAGIESRGIFQSLKDSILNNTCKTQTLDGALAQEIITLEQYANLVRMYARRMEGIVGIDPITNLSDGVFLESRINDLISELNHEKGKRKFPVQAVVVIFLDINKFKALNDTYGHDVGDEALKVLASRLKQSTRRVDQQFRPHGDEFVILLPINTVNPNITEIFETLENKINTNLSVDVDGAKVTFTVSMGYEVLKKGDNKTAGDLLKKADKKMYENKRADRKPPESSNALLFF